MTPDIAIGISLLIALVLIMYGSFYTMVWVITRMTQEMDDWVKEQFKR